MNIKNYIKYIIHNYEVLGKFISSQIYTIKFKLKIQVNI
jgi:hypothetical protein